MDRLRIIVSVGVVLTFWLATSTANGVVNWALNKEVRGIHVTGDTQDTYKFLVDGDTETCADTGPLMVGPALEIDLGGEYLIEAVKLTYAPICATSMTGYGCYFHTTVIEIKGGDKSAEVKDCGHLEDDRGIEAQGEAYLECTPGPILGRYVTIRKETTSRRSIYLCEMQVLGKSMKPEITTQQAEEGPLKLLSLLSTDDNVALNKLVSGINLLGDGIDTYQLLVDGNTKTCADSGTFVVGPAFTVDLGGEYLIEAVKLTYAPTCDTSLTGMDRVLTAAQLPSNAGPPWAHTKQGTATVESLAAVQNDRV
ncbi:uncharacterized protein [Ptychodera flava]|uniref:uncharacterized protein n=1 Tax=Ptychodera flava TaxID=63121 RepID=UPI003969E1ED